MYQKGADSMTRRNEQANTVHRHMMQTGCIQRSGYNGRGGNARTWKGKSADKEAEKTHKNSKKISGTIVAVLAAVLLIALQQPARAEKTGVLFLHVGETEQYQADTWQFYKNIHDVFPAGSFAGGGFEGGNCYTIIHYANEVESEICGVAPGTPIDSFCNEYTGGYEVKSITERGLLGDLSFFRDCYAGLFPYVYLLGDSTIHPETGEEIIGPHVDDPDAAGRGISDFMELINFKRMEFYSEMPDMRNPHIPQLLQWWYGDDKPEGRVSVRDLLTARRPDTEFAFRHGWEFYMRNIDIYGNPHEFPDSTETALRELIVDEGVNRIVVMHSYPSFANLSQYGHEWYDENGMGVSAVPGQTFKECILDLSNNTGPRTAMGVELYIKHKPWETHDEHPFPLIQEIAAGIDPSVEILFAPAYGEFEPFGEAVVAKIRHTVARYEVPEDASLKVILVHHGFGGGFVNAQECDCYNRKVEELFDRVSQVIQRSFVWPSKFEAVHAAAEFAEGSYDPPTYSRPFGKVMSLGEHIETAINGTYVDQLGRRIDNGIDNFDYIIAIPYYYDAESAETIVELREDHLGNNIPNGFRRYERDEHNADGEDYSPEDLDDEFAFVQVYDATGWPSIPRFGWTPVYKGSAERPTTLILTGAMLSTRDDGTVQQKMSEAVVSAIKAVLPQTDSAE